MDWALQQASAKTIAISGFHLPVVSGVATVHRLTEPLAAQRNARVVQLAQTIVVAHASPGGGLAAQVAQWLADGRELHILQTCWHRLTR